MEQLIKEIKTLNKYQNKIAQLTDNNFNIFRICGVNHYETTHSAIITELLKNNSSHSFGNKFFEEFIKTLKAEDIVLRNYFFSLEEIEVIPEFSINSAGRIDIFIRNKTQCLIIENKIYAKDQFEQLKRYEDYAKSVFPNNYIILYLTLWGSEASEQSSKNVNYKQISYNHTIIQWLERCIKISAKAPVIRETLIQYINHINYLTNNTTQSLMKKEIIELLSDEENIEALFTIGDSFNDVKNYLINDIFMPQLDRICEELGLINESATENDWVSKAWSSFRINPPSWNNYQIGFEFEGKNLQNLIKGVVLKPNKVHDETTLQILKTKFIKSNKRWAWSDFPQYRYWGKDAMIAIKNGEMVKIFKQEIEEILRSTNDLNM